MVRMPETHSLSLEPELVAVEIAMIEHPVLLAPISDPVAGHWLDVDQVPNVCAEKIEVNNRRCSANRDGFKKLIWSDCLEVGRIVGRSSFLCAFKISLFDELDGIGPRAVDTKVAKAPPRNLSVCGLLAGIAKNVALRLIGEVQGVTHGHRTHHEGVILRLGLGLGLGVWLGLGIGI